ncbi:hypothetical protein [Moorena sp. SIO3H5]|uniref:RipA family octameric membrane protein n=1 Tax=Moorena sp. SIO3H5 TaxID=2607834 RepID=UPI0013BC6444|nr:hypothetical protein [Moorena sp. SIO3H5]NEO71343.1 hypothetical protein [Moorena sp. SIO3H5]
MTTDKINQSNQNSSENISNRASDKSHLENIVNEKYGDKFHDHLLGEYKIYIEMMDRISSRRNQANQFYISLLSGLFGLVSILIDKNFFSSSHNLILLLLSFLGLILCFVWLTTINSYRQLNLLKFQVIGEMEHYLPFACYSREWEIWKDNKKTYMRLTEVEKYVPIVLATAYFVLFVYSGFNLINK